MSATNGWTPDTPDIRDRLYRDVFSLAARAGGPIRWISNLFNKPKSRIVDLVANTPTSWPDIFNQGNLESCVENAWAAALYYVHTQRWGYPLMPSRLFMWYNVRKGEPRNAGSSIRAGIKSVAKCGLVPEQKWPYDETRWIARPDSELFEQAKPFEDVIYARLTSIQDMIDCIDQGYPFVFGMSLYEPFDFLDSNCCTVEMPTGKEKYRGGHAMLAVGYNTTGPVKTFKVRNSWGPDWGRQGYCYIPMDYLANPMLADDFWMVRYLGR